MSEKKPMRIGVVTKARIGFAIAFGILIGGGEAAAISHIDAVQQHVALFCLVIAAAGLLSWLTGQFFKPLDKGLSPAAKAEREKFSKENPFIFLRSLKYWGMILIFSTGGMYIRNAFQKERPIVVQAKAAAPVVFPPLELEGLTLNGAKSSALINGQVLFIGEEIGRVQLTAVDGDHATVALDGQTKVLTLSR